MPPRLHVDLPLSPGPLELPEGAARHAQVLRLQPGDAVTLFDGRGGEWDAVVDRMGRKDVTTTVQRHRTVDRELPLAVTLAIGMPANDRMDMVVEKASELGAAAIVPLVCERSVLRLSGERAERKRAHWQAIAVAAAEQSGRTRVLQVAPVQGCAAWLSGLDAAGPLAGARWWLSAPRESSTAGDTVLASPPVLPQAAAVWTLSGPEGGFSATEEQAAVAAGFRPVRLGPRVLRADTAPLAALAWLSLSAG